MPSPSYRLSDADRDEFAELLSRHAAAGRLSVEELEARVAALYEAESRSQAAALLADLPPLPAPPVERQRPRRGRGHGEATKPEAGWVPTNERFRDPGSRRIMRVWLEPGTGTRHYVPDEVD